MEIKQMLGGSSNGWFVGGALLPGALKSLTMPLSDPVVLLLVYQCYSHAKLKKNTVVKNSRSCLIPCLCVLCTALWLFDTGVQT